MKKKKRLEIESPEEIIDDITEAEEELHKKLVHTAQEVGKDRERWLALREPLAQAGRETTSPEDAEIFISAIESLGKCRESILGLSRPLGNELGKTASLFSSSSDSTGTITATTVAFLTVSSPIPLFVFKPKVDENEVLKRLTGLDPSLAETYKAVDEVLYGTRSAPERGALYMIRQVFDHFFGILAPDDDVRRSRYWKKKDDKDENRIERIERIRYAANKHIKDKKQRERLLTNGKHMIEVYNALNRAHKPGPLNPEKEKAALCEMRALINDWALAL